MISIGIVRRFGELISEAERRIIEGIEDGRIETEPSMTDRFLNEIERVFSHADHYEGITFKARTLRDRGRNAPEKEFGADFCGVLKARLKDFEVTKGFLSQAKKDGRGIDVNLRPFGLTTVGFQIDEEFVRLGDQIDQMLSITPDSFVIIYSSKGFVVVPAISVKGLKNEADLYAKPVDRFFKEYLMCFIGDHRLVAYDDRSLESLRKETKARTAIMFEVKQAG